MRFLIVAAFAAPIVITGLLAAAQTEPADDLVDPAVPQEERICDQEIDEVEARLEATIDSFSRLEQERLRTQLDEAQQFCDDGNQMMAAIRLEAVTAVIEVSGSAN